MLSLQWSTAPSEAKWSAIKPQVTVGSSGDVMIICAPSGSNNTRSEHNMVSKFEIYESFSGKLGEVISELVATYTDVALNYKHSTNQKLRDFGNLLDDDTKRFYRSYVQPTGTTFGETCIKIQTEYSSITRQNMMRKYLQSPSLALIIENKSWNISEARKELRGMITKCLPQGPGTERSKEDEVKFYMNLRLVQTGPK